MKIINNRIIVFASLCVLLGAALGAIAFRDELLATFIPLALIVGGFLFSVKTKKHTLLILFVALSIGFCAAVIDMKSTQIYTFNGQQQVQGRVCKDSAKTITIEKLSINGKQIEGKANVYTTRNYQIGAEITFVGKVKTDETDLSDSLSATLFNDKIYYFIVPSGEITAKIGEKTFVETAKTKITESIDKYLETNNAGIMKSLLFGDKSDLTENDATTINAIGLSHIFAISGLHIGFLSAVIMLVLGKLRVKPIITLAVTTAVTVFYGAMTGFPSGVKRAMITLFIAQTAKLTSRKNDSLTTLCLSAAIIVLTNPRELFDVGFQMSFLAVLGIVCFYKPIIKNLSKIAKGKIMRYSAKLIATTISANAFVLPITINAFNTFSIYAPVSNLFVLPIIALLFPFSAVVSMLSLVWQGFGVGYHITGTALNIIRFIAQTIASLKGANLTVGAIGAASIAYFAALLVWSPFLLTDKKNKYALSGICGATFLIFAII